MLANHPPREPRTKRECMVFEIADTEAKYVHSLGTIVECYMAATSSSSSSSYSAASAATNTTTNYSQSASSATGDDVTTTTGSPSVRVVSFVCIESLNMTTYKRQGDIYNLIMMIIFEDIIHNQCFLTY